MTFKKVLLTLLVVGISSMAVGAPKGPPTPGCWPPSQCVPINKGMIFLVIGGVAVAYLAFKKRELSVKQS